MIRVALRGVTFFYGFMLDQYAYIIVIIYIKDQIEQNHIYICV